MSASGIQNFLSSKGSVLSGYVIPSETVPGDPNPQPGTGKTAAQHIYDEAQEHGINPQVILVTLRKEQGFLSSQDPNNFPYGLDYALRWAMGYGVYSGSPYMDPNNSNYTGGFGRQVAYAAYAFRSWFDTLSSGNCLNSVVGGCRRVGDTISIPWGGGRDGYASVYLSNQATIILYRYTPYVYNGNYNFYTIFREWFGWSYSLVKTGNSPAIYLVYSNTRYHITDPQSFQIWGFSWSNVNIISEETLNSYSPGSSLSSLIKGSGDAIYLGNNGFKYHIPNPTTFHNFGFSWGGISFPSDNFISSVPYKGILNNLIKGSGAEIFALDQGVKRHIRNIDTFNHFRFRWDSISFLSNEFINSIPSSSFISRLIKGSGERVYLMENGQRRWISSMQVFRNRGYSWSDIGQVSDSLLFSYPEGAPLR